MLGILRISFLIHAKNDWIIETFNVTMTMKSANKSQVFERYFRSMRCYWSGEKCVERDNEISGEQKRGE